GAELAVFHAPPKTIWVLSLALAGILLGNVLKAAVLEIAAWNVLIVSVMLFLAQGGGIVLYTLTRRSLPPLSRFFSNVLLIVVIFSPGINVLALGALVLLGIAENWLPLRAAASGAAKPGG
ncbi:MAG: YybS family protein, partial [Treponema sp.]|nr:YybS family protein [Treponema sp.]